MKGHPSTRPMKAASLTSPKPRTSAFRMADPASERTRKISPAASAVAIPAHQGWLKRLAINATPVAGEIKPARVKPGSRGEKKNCTRERKKKEASRQNSSRAGPQAGGETAEKKAPPPGGPQNRPRL